MAELVELGAAGVQLATRFIATEECDADVRFKQAIVDAKKEDIMIIKSPVGMPARAINSPLIKRLATGEKFLAKKCNNCLTACKKNAEIPYCISRALIEAVIWLNLQVLPIFPLQMLHIRLIILSRKAI